MHPNIYVSMCICYISLWVTTHIRDITGPKTNNHRVLATHIVYLIYEGYEPITKYYNNKTYSCSIWPVLDVENTDISLTVDYILKGLLWYPPPPWIRFHNKSVQYAAVWKTTQIKADALCYALNLIEWVFGLLSRSDHGW